MNIGAGSADDACFETYRGPRPFSEIEVVNTVKYLKALKPTPILAVAVHTAAGLVLTPYGYAEGVEPPVNIKEIVSSLWSNCFFF